MLFPFVFFLGGFVFFWGGFGGKIGFIHLTHAAPTWLPDAEGERFDDHTDYFPADEYGTVTAGDPASGNRACKVVIRVVIRAVVWAVVWAIVGAVVTVVVRAVVIVVIKAVVIVVVKVKAADPASGNRACEATRRPVVCTALGGPLPTPVPRRSRTCLCGARFLHTLGNCRRHRHPVPQHQFQGWCDSISDTVRQVQTFT